jgi:hypothetical protein
LEAEQGEHDKQEAAWTDYPFYFPPFSLGGLGGLGVLAVIPVSQEGYGVPPPTE